jgi:tetratricopeptide (TPR) repeat protein
MIQKLRSLSAAIAIAALTTTSVSAQLKVPAPSPLQTVKQAFALSDITVEYSRPSARGRVVFGDVVPFGKTWRTGANNATKITFGEDVKVEGNDVKAGTYAIYTIPNKDSWEIMFYKDLTLGGNVEDYKKENELLRFVVKPTTMNGDKVETFTIDFSEMNANNVKIELVWEKTRVPFKVVADIDSKIMKTIDNTIVKDTRPYFQAASYYYDNDKDLKQAAEWADKAIANNPKGYWIYMLKAKIQAKQKDSKGAIATAEQVIKIATEEKDEAYVSQAKKLIAENKK